MAETVAGTRPNYIVDPWAIVEDEFNPRFYAFSEGALALSNGLLGRRSSFEEGLCFVKGRRGHYAATVFNARPHPTVIALKGCPENPREIVNLPDFTCLRIFVDGDLVDLTSCEIRNYRRELRMDTGLLVRRVEMTTPGGIDLDYDVTTFVSRRRPHIAAFRFSMRVLNRDASLAIEAGIDAKVTNADGRVHFSECLPEADEEGWSAVRCLTSESETEVAIFSYDELTTMDSACDACSENNRFAGIWFEGRLSTGEPTDFTRIVAVASSADPEAPSDPAECAWRELNHAVDLGFDGLLKEQTEAWNEVWLETGVTLETGDGAAKATLQGLRYALFQLFQHTSAGLPVAARGLVCERASGGCSWDKSLFTLPALALLRPEEAKDIVRRRIAMLPAAGLKSAEMGLSGAMFPWTAGAEGEETCPLWQFSLMGLHATAAVAWGVWFTFRSTGDISLLADGGIDLLVQTARFWASRVFRQNQDDDFELRGVVGLDEYHQGVNNDFYTNALARWNLRIVGRALKVLGREAPTAADEIKRRLELSTDELAEFETISDRLRLGRRPDTGLSLEFDGVDRLESVDIPENVLGNPLDETWTFDRLMRSRILRRAGVVSAQVLLGDCGDRDQRCRDFEYYDPITTHDSPLSICHHAIAAAQIGKVDEAVSLFSRIARLDIDNVLGNSWLGPHVSCLAGVWQCLCHGFLGISFHADQLSLDPALPADWRVLGVSIAWQGKRLMISATRDRVSLAVDHGKLTVMLFGKPVEVGEDTIRIEF